MAAAGSGRGDGGAVVREEEMESRGGRETQRLNGRMWYEVLTKQQTFCSLVCIAPHSSVASLLSNHFRQLDDGERPPGFLNNVSRVYKTTK